GQIVKAICENKEMPLFIFDEIDKVVTGNSYGNPCQALLALTDDSRATFRDAYFDVAIDLSRVPMIFTANELRNVNPYLVDRLVTIEIAGYNSPSDRRTILTDYVIPNVCKQSGLSEEQFVFSEDVVEAILLNDIDHQGGVRSLQASAEAIANEAIFALYSRKTTAEAPIELTTQAINEVLRRNRAKKKIDFGFGRAINSDSRGKNSSAEVALVREVIGKE
ncbi:MAG: hypothetical protein LBI54_04455, partial [Lachnospiraceae bacterium]|nr:hypothetical protein [Lachnospiraceae bacterium]